MTPEPLSPVIHTTQPFWFNSFCLSVLSMGDSCQNMFVDILKYPFLMIWSTTKTLIHYKLLLICKNTFKNNETWSVFSIVLFLCLPFALFLLLYLFLGRCCGKTRTDFNGSGRQLETTVATAKTRSHKTCYFFST